MFASITCPACRHKYTIPEGAMGSRQSCPNCRTPFLAGKSVPEGAIADVPMKYEPVAAAGINKTMLGETEPPVRYNCPRCKKPLESPAIEAGTKKPCPSCGQRLQVPMPPPPPPGLNKTILATSEGNPQAAGVSTAPPPMGSVVSNPAAAPAAQTTPGSLFSRPLAVIGGIVAAGVLFLLCTCLLAIFFSGPSAADREKLAAAQKQFADAQKELAELKESIKKREQDLESARQKASEAEYKKSLDAIMTQFKAQQENLDRQAERDRQAYLNDQQKAAEAKREQERRQRDLDEMKLQELKRQKDNETELKGQIAKLQGEVEAQKNRANTIIQQPPPVVYSYPYYHPYRYWNPWGW
jgi:DNA-directed RNA polymerase subunit RPC12/RpoP